VSYPAYTVAKVLFNPTVDQVLIGNWSSTREVSIQLDGTRYDGVLHGTETYREDGTYTFKPTFQTWKVGEEPSTDVSIKEISANWSITDQFLATASIELSRMKYRATRNIGWVPVPFPIRSDPTSHLVTTVDKDTLEVKQGVFELRDTVSIRL
jgi:hypothetical protein